MAEVYRAHHVSLDRFVAIKVLHDFLADDPEFKSRFEKEARNIARLKHPHIVQVYDFEYDPVNESYYMVMELIDGFTLKDLLYEAEQTGTPISLPEALRITREAASALAYAHKAGMIHRDVKPANLILDRGEGNRVVLTDFGIAKMVTSAQFTVTGGLIGTPAYMSPEQGVGETGDERSDIYSLGVILYQMVTGELPYEADTPLALILKHLNDPIPSACTYNPQLPEQIDYIIAKTIAKEPSDRYQKAGDLIEGIDKLEARLKGGRAGSKQALPPSESSQQSTRSGNLDGPTQPYAKASLSTTQGGHDTVPFEAHRTSNVTWLLGALVFAAITIGGYVVGASNGAFPAVGFLASATPTDAATSSPSPTSTDDLVAIAVETGTYTPTASSTPSATQTSTETPTRTPTSTTTSTVTATPTSTMTEHPTTTATPTATNTVEMTPTLTPNMTQTSSIERTATFAACTFDYAIIEQTPEDGEAGGFFPINRAYERTIKLLNTGTCPWERNTSLTFINGSGESFNAGPRIFIREPVEVGAEVDVIFEGTLPSRGSLSPIIGTWQLRTPGQIPIGESIAISVMVYDPGN